MKIFAEGKLKIMNGKQLPKRIKINTSDAVGSKENIAANPKRASIE